MLTIEEMEGTPQTGLSLSRTIDSIISVVRQSKGEPVPTPEEQDVSAKQLMTLFKDDLARREAEGDAEVQERIDLDTLRRALYSDD